MLGRDQSEIGHQLTRVGKATDVAKLGNERRRRDKRHAAQRLQCTHDRCKGPVRQRRRDLGFQAVTPRHSRLDRRDAILQHDVVCRVLEAQARQPAAMHQCPSRPVIRAALPQQETTQRLTRLAQGPHRGLPRTHEIAHGFMLGIGNPDRRQLAGPAQLGQIDRIAPIRLDPTPGLRGIDEGAATTQPFPASVSWRWMP